MFALWHTMTRAEKRVPSVFSLAHPTPGERKRKERGGGSKVVTRKSPEEEKDGRRRLRQYFFPLARVGAAASLLLPTRVRPTMI